MSGVFVDTSGWASLFVKTETHHSSALALVHSIQRDRRRTITSTWVLAELSALLMSPLRVPRDLRLTMLERIRSADWIEIVHVDQSLETAGWEFLLARRDKDFSLVECSSFVIRQREQLREALTTDVHFEQAGFVRLLK